MEKISSGKITAILALVITWPTALLIGIVIGQAINLPFTADTLSSTVTAIATVAITILTFVLAKETWQLRVIQNKQIHEFQLEGIRPNISIAFGPGNAGLKFFDIKISNTGKGIAKNIRFKLQGREKGIIDGESAALLEFLHSLGALKTGISTLGINQTFESFAFGFPQLGQKTNNQIFKPFVRINAFYEDTIGTEYESEFILDLSQYEGVSQVGTDPPKDIADHLKGIKDSLSRMAPSQRGRLDVNIYNKDDRTEERLEWEQDQADFIARHTTPESKDN